ncbi:MULTISPECIES: hypothetical protein [Vibrio]|uniref:hypothetical protein n=1 Tax=Vibrio TaxID=662 RepID=UPI00142ECE49|nr:MULTISPECIES: hypothetical protein [Vibrio]
MNIEFSRKEMDFIHKNRGNYSDKRYIRDLVREAMKTAEANEESQGAYYDTKPKNKKS